VYRKITPVSREKKVFLRETKRAVKPFGGLCVFFEFLRKVGYGRAVSEAMPFRLKSPNAIDPAQTFTVFLISILAGARRLAHNSLLGADRTSRSPFGRLDAGSGFDGFRALWSARRIEKGLQPEKRGRPSHHPLLAILAQS
jgi:hypothetical protein